MVTNNVFVYGSLLADEVVKVLLHRVPRNLPATVRGYQRFSIKQRRYPATIKTLDNQHVDGRVLFDLTKAELDTLDVFEDDDYYRDIVSADLQDGSHVDAAIYVWQDKYRDLLQGEWDYEHFRREHLASFLSMTEEFERSGEFPEDSDTEPDVIG